MNALFLLRNQNRSTLGDFFHQLCAENTTTQVTDASGTFTAAEIAHLSVKIAGAAQAIDLELNRQLILLLLRNQVIDIAAFFGLSSAGFVPCIADPKWSHNMIFDICDAYGIDVIAGVDLPETFGQRALITPVKQQDGSRDFTMLFRHRPKAPPPFARLPELAFVRFSSGSTGRPKALAFDSEAAVRAAQTWAKAASLSEQDRIFCLATLNNGLAFNTSLLATFLSGSDLILFSGKYNPNLIWRKIAACGPSVLVGFPFLWQILLDGSEHKSAALQSVRGIWSSAAPLEAKLAQDWRNAFGIGIGQYYGIAETGPITFNCGDGDAGVGSVLPECSVRFGSDQTSDKTAQLSIRTPYMALGDLSKNASDINRLSLYDGHYQSSDLGELNAAGELVLDCRRDRVCNIRGQKFDLTSVEHLIAEKLFLSACFLHQMEDSRLALFLETATPLSQLDVLGRCRAFLEGWQIPEQVHCLRSFPRSATGKILALELIDNIQKPEQEKT